ncbi:nickel-dependent hydrogenase [Bradyrhizobium macuxiense]|uniref:Nickel-dependent hydrogenase n=1 Tax=Bradyrhizobium macuxiense TaxID=1755647 RepID=A0A560L4K1_9BRAD|nr:nickel-dependent hydrogenase large subunit [Bradyrhizobium macuxiense]TWB89364.1 nickel-dependent hydrogenase [Bradyrhizobium macuxiense]
MSLAIRNQMQVTVSLADDAIGAVEILPRVQPPLARLFAGKPASSLLNVLPRLFSLCAAAHQVAFLSAIGAARGAGLNLATRQHRMTLVVAERLAELLRGLFVAHLAQDPTSADAIRALIQDVLVLVGSAKAGCRLALSEAAVRIAAALAALGIANEDGAPMPGSPLALRIAALEEVILKPVPMQHSFLSAADDHDIIERLLVNDVSACHCPDLEGRIPETGPWARQMKRGRLSSGRSAPAERLKARIAEIVGLCAWLKAGAHIEIAQDGIVESYGLGPRRGAAAVECARGRLYHAVELDRQGQISRFECLAPTEWNFHSRGPLVRSLQGAGLTARPHARAAIRRVIESLDPCVAFTLNFRDVGDA